MFCKKEGHGYYEHNRKCICPVCIGQEVETAQGIGEEVEAARDPQGQGEIIHVPYDKGNKKFRVTVRISKDAYEDYEVIDESNIQRDADGYIEMRTVEL